MTWFLEQSVYDAMQSAPGITAEQFEVHAASFGSTGGLGVKGGVGEIHVKGILTEDPDIKAVIFGGGNTTYSDIRASLAAADADSSVKRLDIHFTTPGGNVVGMFKTIDAMQRFTKPINAIVERAASAGYALASQATKITAVNPAAEVGSIGVIASIGVNSDVVIVRSTNAPDKNPDPTTEEGQAVIRSHMDGMHDLFVGAIAKGRGTTKATINRDYGRGGIVLAKQAKAAGMIDAIMPGPRRQNKTAIAAGQPEVKNMDLSKLKDEYPAVYAAAAAEGAEAERKMCSAHLTLGAASGDMETAIKAIQNGDSINDPEINAAYQAASMRQNAIAARVADNTDVGAPAGNDAAAAQALGTDPELAAIAAADAEAEILLGLDMDEVE